MVAASGAQLTEVPWHAECSMCCAPDPIAAERMSVVLLSSVCLAFSACFEFIEW